MTGRIDMAKESLEEMYMVDGKIPNGFFPPSLDDAFLGLSYRMNSEVAPVYDVEKILAILVKSDGMTYDEAREFFDFNIGGAWVGDHTPIWVETYWLEENDDSKET